MGVWMVNINGNHPKFGQLEEFTETVADSDTLKRDGWIRQIPVLPEINVNSKTKSKRTKK